MFIFLFVSGDAVLNDLHERDCIADGALLLVIRPLTIASKNVRGMYSEYCTKASLDQWYVAPENQYFQFLLEGGRGSIFGFYDPDSTMFSFGRHIKVTGRDMP